ncbi:MAG TPA: FAD-dependent oxidoreductase, partial [bacterium]|nr:FAD-dependent oxidoreductase [bacterium]
MSEHKPICYKKRDDVPELVMSQASSLWNQTGSWRYIRPRYQDSVPPCNHTCPAGNDIEGFIRHYLAGNTDEAWQVLKEENPFPRVCGRVCYHPCEGACHRGQFDRAVAINDLERFVGDQPPSVRKIAKLKDSSEKSVAVIGAGPAGMTVAYHLARLGHQVTVYDAHAKAGGVLRYGIPAYRLPKDVLDDELNDIFSLGVKFVGEKTLGVNLQWQDLNAFDAVFVATGAHQSRQLGVPDENSEGVMSGLHFLTKVAASKTNFLGDHVVVVGGGNTAIDAARSALRLGSQVTICYYRSRQEMPAHPEEIADAELEGAEIRFLCQPLRIIKTNN